MRDITPKERYVKNLEFRHFERHIVFSQRIRMLKGYIKKSGYLVRGYAGWRKDRFDEKEIRGLKNMHSITELPAWERIFKKIVWQQLGNIEGKKYWILEAAKE